MPVDLQQVGEQVAAEIERLKEFYATLTGIDYDTGKPSSKSFLGMLGGMPVTRTTKQGRKPGAKKSTGKRGRPAKAAGKRGRPKGSGKKTASKGTGKRRGRPPKASAEGVSNPPEVSSASGTEGA